MKKTPPLLTVLVSLAVTGGALAGIDFENPPYTVGDLTGQDGWTDGTTLAVTATDPIAGNQSVIATDIGAPVGGADEFRNITGMRSWADGTRISTLFRAENAGNDGSFFDFRFDTLAGYLGDVTIISHIASEHVVAFSFGVGDVVIGSITSGTVYQVVVEFNFTADTYDAFLQTVDPADPTIVTGTVGSALGNNFANSSSAADANSLTWLLVRAQNGGGPATGSTVLFDNMLGESTPGSQVVPSTNTVVNAPSVSFDSVGGVTYHLQSTSDLVSSGFADVGAFVEGNGQTRQLFDSGGSPADNYRVVGVLDTN
jgi:hypothetical protein